MEAEAPATSGPEPDPEDRIRASAHWHAFRHLYRGWTREQTIERMQSVVPGFPPEAYERELTRAMERAEKQKHDSLRRRQPKVEEIKTLDVLNAVFALHVLNTTRGWQWVNEGLGYIDIHKELGSRFSTQEIDAAQEKAKQVMNDAVRLASGPRNGGHLHELRAKFPECNDNNLGDALDHAYWLTR